ncbi:unnamed protein product [Rangifer tarandus platyrhynchus]|uniref:GDP-mannose 4,6-dehydratase n=1 Tax=Rangifer tarandus platyrhynchus TaxID=3082113 RepID=A0ABN8Z8X8_RANTA|nr:unnamed protein product [Rangifer tarandus platyrhynchus]
MAQAVAHCPGARGAGDAETGKPRKVALITGITGQDGSYLAEFLLEKGYEVHGIVRRSSSFNTGRIEHLYKNPQAHTEGNMKLHYGDLTDSTCLVKIINEVKPTEIYNLGAQSHVKISFDLAEYTADVDGVGTLRLLDAVKTCGLINSVRFYQASTSELYGKVQEIPQKETTPFYPRSPYGAAKLYAYWIVVNFREAYSLFAVNGILFNHESPRRGANFVTRKISRSVAKIHLGQLECFSLGNLDAKRDWGHAKDYVEHSLCPGRARASELHLVSTRTRGLCSWGTETQQSGGLRPDRSPAAELGELPALPGPLAPRSDKGPWTAPASGLRPAAALPVAPSPADSRVSAPEDDRRRSRGPRTRVRKKPQQLCKEGRRPAVPSRDFRCGVLVPSCRLGKVQRQRSWAFGRPCRGHQRGPGDGVRTWGKGRLLQTALSAAHIKCVVRTAAVPASEANATFAGSLPVGSGLWEPVLCWTTLKDGASALGMNR